MLDIMCLWLYYVCMYIETVPNRNSPPCILLRESHRAGKKVHKRTLANLTNWPKHLVDGLRALLKGRSTVLDPSSGFEIIRSLPHGHVAAVLGTLRRVGLEVLISARRCAERDRVVAMIVERIIEPSSKLAMSRDLRPETATTSLGEVLGVGCVDEDDLYAAMDWVLKRQERIERSLASKHLSDGSLLLYDVTSTYFEGRTCPLAKLGRPHDGAKGKLQIVVGLLCTFEGVPVAVKVFEGNTADPKTFREAVRTVRERFGLRRVVWVGDRGMITEARIREDLRGQEGLDWITALRSPQIRGLARSGSIQMSLFDRQDLAEVTSQAYPDERLIVCKNPVLGEERARKRQALLEATERELKRIVEATRRAKRPLRGKDRIGVRVGKVLNRYKVGKHFRQTITEEGFSYERDAEGIAEEAALDGVYVIRTSVPAEQLSAEGTVEAYKRLSRVERAFRSLKTMDLKLRPIHHHLADRVRAHAFLCMLAYYVEWHMRAALAPILFDDDDKEAAQGLRRSVVSPAERSGRAKEKAYTKRTEEDLPVQSFQTLLKDLGTITRNRCRVTCQAESQGPVEAQARQERADTVPPETQVRAKGRRRPKDMAPQATGPYTLEKTTEPTPLQHRALELLGVQL